MQQLFYFATLPVEKWKIKRREKQAQQACRSFEIIFDVLQLETRGGGAASRGNGIRMIGAQNEARVIYLLPVRI